MKKHIAVLFAALVGAALAAGAAQATNIVPNPGFELDCAGLPCGWTATAATITGDTTVKHGGNASLKIVATGAGFGDARACVPAFFGSDTISFWSRFADPHVTGLRYVVGFYSGINCSGHLADTTLSNNANDGQWHLATGTITAPAGTFSVLVAAMVMCPTNPCAANATGYFDDLVLDAPQVQTAARFRYATATRSPRGTLLRWRTASELDVAGFNVYRLEHGRAVKLNRHLIAAKARAGGTYCVLDRGHLGARYRLEVVNLDGTRQTRTVR